MFRGDLLLGREVCDGGRHGQRVLSAGELEGAPSDAGVRVAAGGDGTLHPELVRVNTGPGIVLRLPGHGRRGAAVRGAPQVDTPGNEGLS